MSLEQFKGSAAGAKIAAILTDEAIMRMEDKSLADRPAVEAIGKDIEARVGSLNDDQKKLVGRWVKELLVVRGWKPDRKGRVAANNFFSRGMIYRRFSPAPRRGDGASRLAAAQALVRKLPYPPISSDELIADRRREFEMDK